MGRGRERAAVQSTTATGRGRDASHSHGHQFGSASGGQGYARDHTPAQVKAELGLLGQHVNNHSRDGLAYQDVNPTRRRAALGNGSWVLLLSISHPFIQH